MVRPETHEPLTRYLFEAADVRPWWRSRRILDLKNLLREAQGEPQTPRVPQPGTGPRDQ